MEGTDARSRSMGSEISICFPPADDGHFLSHPVPPTPPPPTSPRFSPPLLSSLPPPSPGCLFLPLVVFLPWLSAVVGPNGEVVTMFPS